MDTLYAIVGASSALGKRLVEDLSSQGYSVAGTYHTGSSDIKGTTMTMRCDVTRLEDIERFASACSDLSGRVFLIYLSAQSRNSIVHRMSQKDWDEVIHVGLTGAFLAAHEFLPFMRKAGWGRIVFAGSVVGRLGIPGTAAYSAVKEGLKGLTKVIANENATKGITVNYLELGYMDAGLTYSIQEEVRTEIEKTIPCGKFGDPGSLSEVMVFLDRAEYITGSILTMSGGL